MRHYAYDHPAARVSAVRLAEPFFSDGEGVSRGAWVTPLHID
jgi:hypothetical protein